VASRLTLAGRWFGKLCFDGPDWDEDPLAGVIVLFELVIEEPEASEWKGTLWKGNPMNLRGSFQAGKAPFAEQGSPSLPVEIVLDDLELEFMVPEWEELDGPDAGKRAWLVRGEVDTAQGTVSGEWELGTLLPEYGPNFIDNVTTGSFVLQRSPFEPA